MSDFLYFCHTISAVIAQLVEHRLPKPRVTGSSPAYRSVFHRRATVLLLFVFFVDVRENKFSAPLPKNEPTACSSMSRGKVVWGRVAGIK